MLRRIDITYEIDDTGGGYYEIGRGNTGSGTGEPAFERTFGNKVRRTTYTYVLLHQSFL
jgi:hypothetical protein